MYRVVQRWFLGQLTSMTLIGLLFTVAMFIIGIPFALLLGIFSGLISFVPFLGPVISVIPPVLLALTGDPIDALWVIVAYVIIQAIEGNLIQPIVMSRAVSLHPAVVMFGLLIMGTRSEEHTSELQSRQYLVCRLLLEKKKLTIIHNYSST